MTVWHLYIPIVFFLSAVTWDRFNHFAWATAFFIVSLIIFAGIKKIRGNKSVLIRYWLQASRPSNVSKTHGFIMSLFVLYLGSWLPDSDWLIYSHRNPLTHSILPFLFMTWLIDKWKFGNHDWNKLLLIMFGYGLGSHLLTDIIPGGNVVWLPAYIDMPFLFINGLSCIIISHRSISKRLKMDHDFNKSMKPCNHNGESGKFCTKCGEKIFNKETGGVKSQHTYKFLAGSGRAIAATGKFGGVAINKTIKGTANVATHKITKSSLKGVFFLGKNLIVRVFKITGTLIQGVGYAAKKSWLGIKKLRSNKGEQL